MTSLLKFDHFRMLASSGTPSSHAIGLKLVAFCVPTAQVVAIFSYPMGYSLSQCMKCGTRCGVIRVVWSNIIWIQSAEMLSLVVMWDRM